jgi:hypothetical protein
VVKVPVAPEPLAEACMTTPTRLRGVAVVGWNGVVNALYTTYTSVPLGDIAGAV